MPAIQASRRLVKSPPELWAEVSDAASLARHLGEVGEIRITRLEPETTVAWEGERASGTVALAPAGWGTSVTLTAEPIVAEPATPEPEPEPIAVAEPPTIGIEGEDAAEPEPEPAAEPKRSWFQRLFGKRRRAADADRAGGAGETTSAAPPAESSGWAGSDRPARSDAEPAVEEPDPLEQALTNALDSLGQAHHRPFSRG
ncbi:MAG: hypothetical protein ACTHOE_09850 [Conexibacter sp.]